MFLLNEILVFTPGRRQEALDRLAWIHGLMASKPGFRRAIVAKYLGDGTKHTVLRVWEDQDAFQRFREGPDGNYGKGRPEGLYTNEKVIPQWESSSESRPAGAGDFLVKVERQVPAEAMGAYDAYEKRLQQIILGSNGRAGLWTFRTRDGGESLFLARYPSRADFERLLESADFAAGMQAMPAGVTRGPTQCFEVVSEMLPPS